MPHEHFLFSSDGYAFLLKEYVENARSTYDLSKQMNIYPNLINRALRYHGIAIRTKSEAQKLALQSGRHAHPTKGKELTQKTKDKIGKKLSESWNRISEEERERRSENTTKQWEERTPEEKSDILSKANSKVRESSKNGSKLEQYLNLGLKVAGFNVNFHSQFLIENEKMHIDLTVYRENDKVAIEVDGPTHHLPIFGEELLAKNRKADAEKNGLLINNGFKVIRVKNLTKNLSKVKMDNCLQELTALLCGDLGEYTEIEVSK